MFCKMNSLDSTCCSVRLCFLTLYHYELLAFFIGLFDAGNGLEDNVVIQFGVSSINPVSYPWCLSSVVQKLFEIFGWLKLPSCGQFFVGSGLNEPQNIVPYRAMAHYLCVCFR